MEFVEQKILSEGVQEGTTLKVHNFLNRRVDVDFLTAVGKEFYRLYQNAGVTKILTIEANAIAIACITAENFHCPVIIAKKSVGVREPEGRHVSTVHSVAKNANYAVSVHCDHLGVGDRVLIIDDLLANGSAMEAMLELCREAGAQAVGAGVVIEKAYMDGGKKLRHRGVRVEALARIASIGEDGIKFC